MLAAVPSWVIDATLFAVAITAVIAAGKAVYWAAMNLHHTIVTSVVDAVVVEVSAKVDTITKELKPNGGSSMFDKLEKRFDAQDERLARNELRVATLTEVVGEIKSEQAIDIDQRGTE